MKVLLFCQKKKEVHLFLLCQSACFSEVSLLTQNNYRVTESLPMTILSDVIIWNITPLYLCWLTSKYSPILHTSEGLGGYQILIWVLRSNHSPTGSLPRPRNKAWLSTDLHVCAWGKDLSAKAERFTTHDKKYGDTSIFLFIRVGRHISIRLSQSIFCYHEDLPCRRRAPSLPLFINIQHDRRILVFLFI